MIWMYSPYLYIIQLKLKTTWRCFSSFHNKFVARQHFRSIPSKSASSGTKGESRCDSGTKCNIQNDCRMGRQGRDTRMCCWLLGEQYSDMNLHVIHSREMLLISLSLLFQNTKQLDTILFEFQLANKNEFRFMLYIKPLLLPTSINSACFTKVNFQLNPWKTLFQNWKKSFFIRRWGYWQRSCVVNRTYLFTQTNACMKSYFTARILPFRASFEWAVSELTRMS